MDFAKPELLNLLFVIIILFIVFYIYYLWQKNIINTIFHKKTFHQISPKHSRSMKIIHFILRVVVLVFLIIALAGPRIGTKLKTINREGVDVVFALDVSKSMLVEDIAPSRLLKSIQILSKTIDQIVSDRVGIIVYAGEAYPLMPLSFDYSMAKLLIKTIDTDIVNMQGTDIASALLLSDSFFDKKDRSKIIFIISDGEDHEGNYSVKTPDLSDGNTIVSAINIGTESGGPIPISLKQGSGYKKDKNGEVIISKSNSKALESIVASYNGAFIKTKDTKDVVDFVLNNMQALDKTEGEEQMYSDYEDQFQWFLGFALFFLLFDLILSQKKINFIHQIIKKT